MIIFNCIKLEKKIINHRSFSVSVSKLISDFFGRSKIIKDIINRQDDFDQPNNDKIVILNEENSNQNKKVLLKIEIHQWKFKNLKLKDVENTYNRENLIKIFNETYFTLKNEIIDESDYKNIGLENLFFRFSFVKLLQQKLGFNINDYNVTCSHTVKELFTFFFKCVSKRWSSERNPNAIVLRKEDFKSPNIYLNEELDEKKQELKFEEYLIKSKENFN